MEYTNKLINETSPYLLQHAHNPVDWYPWGVEAFQRAVGENKPIFLSIGYSTCHWCHVMEHESFEDQEVAQFLNKYFIAIKVDKEERPDIDSIYMGVCQAMTGSGGWPMTILMTPQQKPFYAGTYLPKYSRHNILGLLDLLAQAEVKWRTEKNSVEQFAENMVDFFNKPKATEKRIVLSQQCLRDAYESMRERFDEEFGGFGNAPKFPMAHGLSFLLDYYKSSGEEQARHMAEKTLMQMYRGGIFDHIGFGFSRYATDKEWLVPHFEKMLYDNALLVMAYAKAYEATGGNIYKEIVSKTITYLCRELMDPTGGFYCAQDADSEGVEGRYYVFKPAEIKAILGDAVGKQFNDAFHITEKGNFEGNSIPNLIASSTIDHRLDAYLQKIYDYRRKRYQLHIDDKILTAWNGLMIAALAMAYKVFKDKTYLSVAERVATFVKDHLTEGDHIYTSYRNGKRTTTSFIDDYAFYIFALLELYRVTFQKVYLEDAHRFMQKAVEEFYDDKKGGFYLYGQSGEKLFTRPKEQYDGAMPSGNSVMAYNLLLLSRYIKTASYEEITKKQFSFMQKECAAYPSGNTFFMSALLLYEKPPKEIVCVLGKNSSVDGVVHQLPSDAIVTMLIEETKDYPLKNDQTTYYVCENNHCLPPTNTLE